MGEDRRLFKNNVDRVIGVVTLDHRNDPKGIPLQPGEAVYLNEVERRLTANAPAAAESNPFTNGDLAEVSPDERPIPEPRAIDAPEGKVIPPEDVEATAAAKEGEEEVVEPVPGNLDGTDSPPAPEETGTQVTEEQQGTEEGARQEEEEVATPEAQAPVEEETGDEKPDFLSEEEFEAIEEATAKADEPESEEKGTVASSPDDKAKKKDK